MLNIWQPWLAAERTNPQDVNSPFEQKFSFRLPVISCTHLHIVTLFLVFLFSFRRLKLNALKAWRQYLLLMKKEREREERRNQLRRRVAEILPNFQTWQKRDEMRWDEKETRPVLFSAISCWQTSPGGRLTKCRGSYAKGSSLWSLVLQTS